MTRVKRTNGEDQVNDVLSLFKQFADDPFWKKPARWSQFQAPSLDLSESDDDYLIEIEAPGMEPDDLEITLSDNTLTVKGEKVQGGTTEERDYHRTERRYGSFTRQVHLPDSVDEEDIDAEYERGILRITVPKAEETARKQIEVNVKE